LERFTIGAARGVDRILRPVAVAALTLMPRASRAKDIEDAKKKVELRVFLEQSERH